MTDAQLEAKWFNDHIQIWTVYKLSVPEWFKKKYYEGMIYVIQRYCPKGSYVIIDTSYGYNIMCLNSAMIGNPGGLCTEITLYYENLIHSCGETPYRSELGVEQFFCTYHDAGSYNYPLPGKYEGEHLVKVINKEDFEQQGE